MSEEIDRWVAYMKSHPKEWKIKHSRFINAQFQKSKEFQKRLLNTSNGKKKLINLYGIKNLEGFPKLK